jgi:GAF domain-containing protein
MGRWHVIMSDEIASADDVFGGITELQKVLRDTGSVGQFLQELALLAARLVTGGLSCGMTMRPDGRPVTVACSDEVAWPEFESRAASRGIRSCLALPLIADGKPVGALNLYARAVDAFGAAETRRAERLAENASGALALALRLASYAALTDQLRSSLASRTVIDQALGVIHGAGAVHPGPGIGPAAARIAEPQREAA